MEYNKTFQDIVGHWAEKSIEIMAAKHIVNGVTDNLFAPDMSITRAEFAAMLTRSLGLKQLSAEMSFNDVPTGAWYRGEVSKAFAVKIISGIDDHAGLFL